MKTIQATLHLLKQKSGGSEIGCLDLFYFLGCFQSSGLRDATLQRIWPNNTLGDSLYLMEKLGMMQESTNSSKIGRKALNRFLTKFVDKSDF